MSLEIEDLILYKLPPNGRKENAVVQTSNRGSPRSFNNKTPETVGPITKRPSSHRVARQREHAYGIGTVEESR